MSARSNIHSYAPDCITSLKSIGEGESSTGNLEGDCTSQGTKKTSLKHAVQFSLLLSFTHYKQARKGSLFLQGSKHLKDHSRTIYSSLSDLSLPPSPLHFFTHMRKSLFQLGLWVCVWNSHLRDCVTELPRQGRLRVCACRNRICWLSSQAQRRSLVAAFQGTQEG